MTDAIYYPKELGDVLDRALDRCFGCIHRGERESIAFMVIMDLTGVITDQRIVIELIDDQLKPLDNRLERDKENIKIYALAFDGAVLWEGRSQPAIVIEVAERENDECLLLAQRYDLREGSNPPFKLRKRLDLVGCDRSRIAAQNNWALGPSDHRQLDGAAETRIAKAE